jgi:hypothetical protein
MLNIDSLKRLLFAVLIVVAASDCNAQEYPSKLIGFFKPDMHVSLTRGDGVHYAVTIYASQDQMQLDSDSRNLEFKLLRSKYESVDRQAKEFIAAQAKKGVDVEKEGFELKVVLPKNKARFGEVAHVGEDYLVFESVNNKKVIVAQWLISDVSLSDGSIFIFGTRTSNGKRSEIYTDEMIAEFKKVSEN